MSDLRTAAAERLLAERGIAGARVLAEGTGGEIAAILLPADVLPELLEERGAEIAGELRALGFRYVAVDLG